MSIVSGEVLGWCCRRLGLPGKRGAAIHMADGPILGRACIHRLAQALTIDRRPSYVSCLFPYSLLGVGIHPCSTSMHAFIHTFLEGSKQSSNQTRKLPTNPADAHVHQVDHRLEAAKQARRAVGMPQRSVSPR